MWTYISPFTLSFVLHISNLFNFVSRFLSLHLLLSFPLIGIKQWWYLPFSESIVKQRQKSSDPRILAVLLERLIQRTQHGSVPTTFFLGCDSWTDLALEGREGLPAGQSLASAHTPGGKDEAGYAGRRRLILLRPAQHHLPQPSQKWNIVPSMEIWGQRKRCRLLDDKPEAQRPT